MSTDAPRTRLAVFADSLTREMEDAYDKRMEESYTSHPDEMLEDAEEAAHVAARAVAERRVREFVVNIDDAVGAHGHAARYLDKPSDPVVTPRAET